MASLRSAQELYKTIKPHLVWIDIPYGHVLVFNQTLMHGNRVNEEAGTRWTMNCRFKSIMSPYADKRFGEFFEPISLRAGDPDRHAIQIARWLRCLSAADIAAISAPARSTAAGRRSTSRTS